MLISLDYPLKSDEIIITKFFFINCLPDEDVGVFNRCYEDISSITLNKTIYKDRYERIDCNSAARFLNALDKIFEEVDLYRLHHAVRTSNIMHTVLPFIHIEAHGSKEAIHMANGEIVTAEIFYEKILKINIASENNTILLSNTCYAMSHIFNLEGYKKIQEKGLPHATPVYIALGPEKEINSKDIENNLVPLYKKLLANTENAGVATQEYAKAVDIKIYFCELTWKRHIKYIISKWYPYKKHKEERLTNFINNKPILQHLSITETRKELKESHPQELHFVFKETEKEFLIGKKSTYTLQDVIKDLDEENKK